MNNEQEKHTEKTVKSLTSFLNNANKTKVWKEKSIIGSVDVVYEPHNKWMCNCAWWYNMEHCEELQQRKKYELTIDQHLCFTPF